MPLKIKINSKLIGLGQPCFIIAEAGVNHNGSLKIAKKMIDSAKSAGADAVKFQTFKADDLVIPETQMAEYQRNNLKKDISQNEMLKKLELPFSAFRKLKKYCDQKNIIFLSSPHTESAVDFLDALTPAYKIGSGDLTNHILLEKIAKKKKPIILGTGMATLKEIRLAIQTIKKSGNNKIILLHCTTNYPCPLWQVNLTAMQTLKKQFNLPIGYSDHTLGSLVPIMAVSLGAVIIEKHFTLSQSLPGPDHKASLEPKTLKDMIKKIRQAEIALGTSAKKPTKEELEIKKYIRKSIVAIVDIPANTKITKNMLAIKRPGTGISPKEIQKIIHKKTKKDIKKNELISWQKIAI